jgi:hypothetical protein
VVNKLDFANANFLVCARAFLRGRRGAERTANGRKLLCGFSLVGFQVIVYTQTALERSLQGYRRVFLNTDPQARAKRPKSQPKTPILGL